MVIVLLALSLLFSPHLFVSKVVVKKRTVSFVLSVDGHPEHRVLRVEAQSEDVVRGSTFELSAKQNQYPVLWVSMRPGLYFLEAELWNEDGRKAASTGAYFMVGF